jgi:hypothetical protein
MSIATVATASVALPLKGRDHNLAVITCEATRKAGPCRLESAYARMHPTHRHTVEIQVGKDGWRTRRNCRVVGVKVHLQGVPPAHEGTRSVAGGQHDCGQHSVMALHVRPQYVLKVHHRRRLPHRSSPSEDW